MRPRSYAWAALLALVGFLLWWLWPSSSDRPAPILPRSQASVASSANSDRTEPSLAAAASVVAPVTADSSAPEAFLIGRVTCKETSQPIARAFLSVLPVEDPMSWPSGWTAGLSLTETDAEGGFRLRVPLKGDGLKRYRLTLKADSFPDYLSWGEALKVLCLKYGASGQKALAGLKVSREDMETLTFPPLAPGEERRHDIAWSRGLGFLITALRSDNGQPVEGASVIIGNTPGSFVPMSITMRSPPKVVGSLEGLIDASVEDLDTLVLQIRKGELTSPEIRLKDCPWIDGRKVATVRMDMGKALRGRVLGPDGRPYAKGCGIRCWPSGMDFSKARVSDEVVVRWVELQDDGTFLLEGLLQERSYSHFAMGEDAVLPAPVTVSPGQDVTLLLQEGESVSGKVIDAKGTPVAGAVVAAWFPDLLEEVFVRTAQTDAAGGYRLMGLPRWPGLVVGAYPAPGKGSCPAVIVQGDEHEPVSSDGKAWRRPTGWTGIPTGLSNLDIVLDDSGLRPYR